MNKYLIVVAGPTGIGKTDLAVELAQHFNAEIISADSRQMFKELNIGVARPSPEQLEKVKHHFVSFLSIDQDYNAGQFETDALLCLDNIFEENDIALLVGGSGLYIQAVCQGLDNFPPADDKVRKQLIAKYETEELEILQNELQKLDPDYYQTVDRQNPQRLIRALEVCISTGKPFSSFHTKSSKKRDFNVVKIGLNMERQTLYERINKRVDQMMEAGLLEEVKKLKEYQTLNSLQTVGYQELFDYLDGKTDLETAVGLIKQHSRGYAKRQLTWFNRDKEIHWFEPGQLPAIKEFLKQRIQ